MRMHDPRGPNGAAIGAKRAARQAARRRAVIRYDIVEEKLAVGSVHGATAPRVFIPSGAWRAQLADTIRDVFKLAPRRTRARARGA